MLRHALRPSSFSLVTLAGVNLGRLMGGAVIVEFIFGLPGLGQEIFNSVNHRDLPLMQGLVMFVAILYLLLNLGVEILYGLLDPRVRTKGYGSRFLASLPPAQWLYLVYEDWAMRSGRRDLATHYLVEAER